MRLDVGKVGRASYSSPSFVYPVENVFGYSLKLVLRKVAKKLPEYHTPVTPVRYGRSDEGVEIPVDTLGRWAFGVPGYQGHCIFDGGSSVITIYYPECEGALRETLWLMFTKAVSVISKGW